MLVIQLAHASFYEYCCCVQGHTAPVTSIHASEYGMQLWSGAQDGGMHAWDMRNKPSQPAVKLHQVNLYLPCNDREQTVLHADSRFLSSDLPTCLG